MTTSLRTPTPAQPCVLPNETADPPERFLEWRRPCSRIYISERAASRHLSAREVQGALNRSIAAWEAVTCGGVPLGIDIIVPDHGATCSLPLYREEGGNVNALMFIDDWTERRYDAAAYAVTTVWHRRSTGEILDADIEINERRGPYGICPDEGCGGDRTVDLENVLTHELGHYLGLAHSDVVDATMFASASAGEVHKRDLDLDDIEGICEIYPPGRPIGECQYEPIGGLDVGCGEGCSVAVPGAAPPGRGDSSSPGVPLVFAPLLALMLRRRARLTSLRAGASNSGANAP